MSEFMKCFGATHVGRRRSANQDQFLIADLSKSMTVDQTSLGVDHKTRLYGASQGKLLLVADGMGGHEAGERASQLVVDSIVNYVLDSLQWFFRLGTAGDEAFCEELKNALRHCQAVLKQEAKLIPQRRGMGTTLTLAYVIWPRMYVVHAGDSRCYVLRENELQQITRDHTLSQLYRESRNKEDRPDSGNEAQWNNTLWNVVSSEDDLSPEVYRFNLNYGDQILLCTDGLYKHLSDEQMSQQMTDSDDVEKTCQGLIDRANEEGGSDNITAIVACMAQRGEEGSGIDGLADTVEFEGPLGKTTEFPPQNGQD